MTIPTPPPLITLDYQRLDRARKVAIGGLRLLALALIAIGTFQLYLAFTNPMFRPRSLLDIPYYATMFVPLFLGIIKFACSFFIARRSRPAAAVALCFMSLETLGLLAFFAFLVYNAFTAVNSYDTFLPRFTPPALLLLILIGFFAIDYEIFQVFRREKSSVIPGD